MKHIIRWFLRSAAVAGYLLSVRWLMKIGKPRDDLWQIEEWYMHVRNRLQNSVGLLRAAWFDITGQTQRRWRQLQQNAERLEFGLDGAV